MSKGAAMLPEDEHNRNLTANVHPEGWVNPEPLARYNLVVIGAGTAGLVTAAGAAGLGAKVALVERHLMGGDCLNFGCVPSKAIIRCARVAQQVREAKRFGVRVPGGVEVDFPAVMARMREIRASISAHDSAARFKELGVDVFLGEARFEPPDTVVVGRHKLRYKNAVIATGARAVKPRIEGIDEVGFLTNETVFSLTELPKRLAVIGGGPIGCELAQAFSRLGSEVTLFHRHGHILDREDPDAAQIVQKRFIDEGINLLLNTNPIRAERSEEGKVIHYKTGDEELSIEVDEILAGAGRAPNVEGLNLEAMGVEYDSRAGVRVNDRLRTTNMKIYAAGDISLRYKFTHTADAAARIVIQNALFAGRKKLSALTVPWCTYTDPEIAHVGMYEADAKREGIETETFMVHMDDVDRALTDGQSEGFVKVLVKKGTGEILGATIVASHAGDMISEITLAIVGGVGLKTLSGVIHPYPTQAEAIKKVADAYSRTRLTPFIKNMFTRWLAFSR